MGSLPMPGRASSYLSKLHCQNEDTTTSGPLLRWLLNRVRGGDRVGSISLNSKRLLLSSPIVYPAPGLLTQ